MSHTNHSLRRRHTLQALGGLAALAATAPLAAQSRSGDAAFPNRPITLIVAGPPAGGTDGIARILAAELTTLLGQSVIVENRAGAGGIIGTKLLLNAAADGYTLLMGHSSTNAIVPALVKPRPYDPVGDFTAVAEIGRASDVLIVPASSATRSVNDLIALARTRALNYGSPGVGLSQHIGGFAFARATGIEAVHVPYRGSAPALVDLVSGRLDYMFVTPGAIGAQLRSGQIRAIAVNAPARNSFFPDVPTLIEAGYAQVLQQTWFGVFAPAGLADPAGKRLSAAIATAMSRPQVRNRLLELFLEPAEDTSSASFSRLVEQQAGHWRKVIDELGITVD